jgi:predicted amidohydrolase
MIHRIAVAQAHPQIGDVPVNVAHCIDLMEKASREGAELVVLPELATTGYLLRDHKEFEHVLSQGTGIPEIAEASARLNIIVVVGYAEFIRGELFNKAVLIQDGEILGDYVKTHLWNNEKNLFTPGTSLPEVFDTRIGKVALAVCYDLEFPELVQHCGKKGAELIAAPTNWPAEATPLSQVGPFNIELIRAMANASYSKVFIAIACRTGEERGMTWIESSCVIDPSGFPLARAKQGVDIAYADCDFTLTHDKNISPLNNVFGDRREDLYGF